MALFQKSRPKTYRPPRQSYQANPLPENFRHLAEYCHHDFGPVPMKFIGFGISNQGAPVARYVCSVCNAIKEMGRHFQSGKPVLVFSTARR